MHHFLYPNKDTFITNCEGYEYKNFGTDEVLEVMSLQSVDLVLTVTGSVNQWIVAPTSSTAYGVEGQITYDQNSQTYFLYTENHWTTASVSDFSYTTFNTTSSGVNYFLNKFTGSVIGTLSGSGASSDLWVTSSVYGTIVGFSGSIEGTVDSVPYSGTYNNLNGLFSASLAGRITSSFSASLTYASGSLTGYTGKYIGSLVSGSLLIYNTYTRTQFAPEMSRTLIRFDLSEISASIAANEIDDLDTLKFYLRLKSLETNEVPLNYTVYAYPLSQSWDMGTGRLAYNGTLDGASWYNRTPNSIWYGTSSVDDFTTNNYLTASTYSDQSFRKGGGTWFYKVPDNYTTSSISYFSDINNSSSLICSQSFDYSEADVYMDVTRMVKAWLVNAIPNEGMIILSSEEVSPVDNSFLKLQFYSKETNTIYSPALDAVWDDSVFETGSLSAVSTFEDFDISIKNLAKELSYGNVNKVRIFAREKYPLKNFTKGTQFSQYLTASYLPSSSYYMIKDNESEEVVYGFDNYTKISCDGEYNYFTLDTTTLPQERYLRVIIKSVLPDEVKILDKGYIFKVTRT